MINVITIVGRLTRDPEIRAIQATGNSVASFTIACDDSRKGPNGEKQTVFIKCSIFGKQAESMCKYTHKGSMVGVVGRLVQHKYTNKDGVEVVATEIQADRTEFMDGKKQDEQPAPMLDDNGYAMKKKPFDPNEEQDLPF